MHNDQMWTVTYLRTWWRGPISENPQRLNSPTGTFIDDIRRAPKTHAAPEILLQYCFLLRRPRLANILPPSPLSTYRISGLQPKEHLGH